MPSKLELKKLLQARSERVKCVDFHGEQPWLLTALYSGNLSVWDLETQSLIKQVEVSNTPVRSARFVSRHQAIIAGSDDCTLRVYNVFTMERLSQVENAHGDYIRSISVHPSKDLVLTSSDDMSIKLWSLASMPSLVCIATFEGHIHYVMQAAWNPSPASVQFVSGSLDKTLKVWTVAASLLSSSPPPAGTSTGSQLALFTLSGHSKGVNAVAYNGTGVTVVSGSDDRSLRVWDLHTRSCLHVVSEAHTNNVTAVAFVPGQPLFVSASEDGKVQFWHSTTFKRESFDSTSTSGGGINYLLDRCWSAAISDRPSNVLALGFDEGAVVVRVGADRPVAAVTAAARGRCVFARGAEVFALVRGAAGGAAVLPGGGRVEVVEESTHWVKKELGTSEAGHVQRIVFHPDGRSFAVVGAENQWVAYSTQAFRVRSFGSGSELVFQTQSPGVLGGEGETVKACVLDERRLRMLDGETLKEEFSVELGERCEGIYGGRFLGVRFAESVVFLDWASGEVVGRIDDVQVAQVLWSPQGTTVAVVTENEKTTYLLRPQMLMAGTSEADFAVVGELRETTVKSGVWLTEECLLFVASETNKVCVTYVGGSTYETLCLSPVSSLYVLGVVEGNKVVFVDKDYKVYSVVLDQHILDYKCAIVNEEFEKAQVIFESIDVSQHNQLAVFLEQHGLPREALQITNDPEHKFNLALTLGALDVAQQVCMQQHGNLNKWRLLGDKALAIGNLNLAVKAFEAANDAESLLLIAATTCEISLLQKTSEIAAKNKLNNVALYANLLMRNSSSCMAILEKENRLAEAALLARTFATDKLPEIFLKWQGKLAKTNEKLAHALKPLHEIPRHSRSSASGSPRSTTRPNPEELLLS